MVLRLEKMGTNNNELNDVKNHRVRCEIINKEGNRTVIDFSKCEIWKMRYTHKKTGKELKHPKKDIIQPIGLHIDTCEYTDNGCFGLREIESSVWSMGLEYTLANILKVVNLISKDQYNSIELVD